MRLRTHRTIVVYVCVSCDEEHEGFPAEPCCEEDE
jgi:hypothetical protein